MKKLSTLDVIAHLENGAILTKNYGVYSHWDLKLIDGSVIYDSNIRKGACFKVSLNDKINIILFNRDENGYSLKLNK
jgi:hypothetical protein